jgi:hypothetical protein
LIYRRYASSERQSDALHQRGSFLQLVDTAYAAHAAIESIFDNDCADISKKTRAWLADQPASRYEFTFAGAIDPIDGRWSVDTPSWRHSSRDRSAAGLFHRGALFSGPAAAW